MFKKWTRVEIRWSLHTPRDIQWAMCLWGNLIINNHGTLAEQPLQYISTLPSPSSHHLSDSALLALQYKFDVIHLLVTPLLLTKHGLRLAVFGSFLSFPIGMLWHYSLDFLAHKRLPKLIPQRWLAFVFILASVFILSLHFILIS